MRWAVASGKGGAGKTTLATNLARVASQADYRVAYLDCDVEEPNGHLFLRPAIVQRQDLTKLVPRVDARSCQRCGACDAFCPYGAIVQVATQIVVFDELCHACGGCTLVCPHGAIREQAVVVGRVRIGVSGTIGFVDGQLHVGQHWGPPAIHAAKQLASAQRSVLFAAGDGAGDELRIIDAPPGTACSMVEAVRGSDLVILVAEPTPFGAYDLALALDTVALLQLPVGVVINRAGEGNELIYDCCRRAGVMVLGELPDQRGGRSVCPRPVGRGPGPRVWSARGADPGAGGRWSGVIMPSELVVISGKGGTGKTSLASALAVLWQPSAVVVDADVDAPDLHLVLQPEPVAGTPYVGGEQAVLDAALCTGCGRCVKLCRFGALQWEEGDRAQIPHLDVVACEGCGVCARFCPRDAVEMQPVVRGLWFVAPCRTGLLVHARMQPGAENSGKLVTLLRQAAAHVAARQRRPLILCDGSPGVGCPVTASLTGADLALIVTTLHQDARVAQDAVKRRPSETQ